jgi:beta-phosphoglucomutase family hydrolase
MMESEKYPAFEAVVFDLDGVITGTAAIHSSAWKKMFDEYLYRREKEHDEHYRAFSRRDYLLYVDGKPRYEGVASFLKSRGIDIPQGLPGDSSVIETICGLGNRKNEMFKEVLTEKGAEVFPSSKTLLFSLKNAGVKLGVASSSKNCRAVLESVGLLHLFDARVDGLVSEELNLKGKPEPDIFIRSCEMLGTNPSESIVIEDAVSGVQAGSNGGFGLVVGIARGNNASELKEHGADVVVADLEEVNGVNGLNKLFLQFHST